MFIVLASTTMNLFVRTCGMCKDSVLEMVTQLNYRFLQTVILC